MNPLELNKQFGGRLCRLGRMAAVNRNTKEDWNEHETSIDVFSLCPRGGMRLEVANGPGGALDVRSERSYPTVEVAQFCTARRKSVPAEKTTTVQSMAVPSPVMMAMGARPTEKPFYSADKKSMIVEDGNRTWTSTPSVTPPGK